MDDFIFRASGGLDGGGGRKAGDRCRRDGASHHRRETVCAGAAAGDESGEATELEPLGTGGQGCLTESDERRRKWLNIILWFIPMQSCFRCCLMTSFGRLRMTSGKMG